MKLQFTHQAYQQTAVNAVVEIFSGQPLAKTDFSLTGPSSSTHYAANGSIGNALVLTHDQILANLQAGQQARGLSVSPELVPSVSDNRQEHYCPLNFSIAMETGTGKTYTFIKTIYELNRHYGFKKFVIVVPSVAIREGTMKNLEITRPHFAIDYAHVPCATVLYDSSKPADLRHFAQSDALSILVINIDSFAKDSKEDEKKSNKILQKGEMPFAPIEYIRATHPIVIVDEPQNFETDVRRKALANLNPLCTLRYSATHKNTYNLLYALNPVQAYDLGLVKQIEVDGVQADQDHNQAFVELLRIDAKPSGLTARVKIDVNDKSGPKRKELSLKVGDDLFQKSAGREAYQNGYILNEFLSDEEIEFSGGRILRVSQSQGGHTDDVMRFQIERTVAAHFAKLKNMQPIGVKVLSLFFIDKVANYRAFDAQGNRVAGKFEKWFEEAFNQYTSKPQYRGLIPHAAHEVHDGYFSGDKKGKGAQAQTVWVDTTEKGSAKDDSTYALIMKDKERLLNPDVPLQFIFSHSALREGWDNPNVFQICTLNETQSAMKKRQEIGRGLRLCVNKHGRRIEDKRVNVLTVIPNQSYEAFAKGLQHEIEEEAGVSFDKRIKNARAKARIQRKPLNAEEQAIFKAIWDKISYQTRYSVKLDTPKLIAKCTEALGDLNQYPQVERPKVRSNKAKIIMNTEGVHGVQSGIGEYSVESHTVSVPDVYAYIQNRVHLSRSTIFSILEGSGRLSELTTNPQSFLDTAIAAIKNTLQELLVEGIQYHEINGRRYEMSLFNEELETYLSSVYPPAQDDMTTPISKTLLQAQPLDEYQGSRGEPFSCVLSDSEIESQFAHDCSIDERVRFFFKLPSQFKIPTPLGTYNPDWAVVFENDARVYFVAETKSSTLESERRQSENLKIRCGRQHFQLAQQVGFEAVTSLRDLKRALDD